MASKRILVLGAGFGGLRAATQIANKLRRLDLDKKYEVVLVDKNEHHTYTPLLYEVATTSKTTANTCRLHEVAAYGLQSLIGGLPIKFIWDEVLGLDAKNGEVRLKNHGVFDCDRLVFALGSETNYFDIKGLEENSLPLKGFLDAIKIRNHIWDLATEERSDIPISQYPGIKVLIGGGGSTGVELAGEIGAWCGELEDEMPRCRLVVEIIESGPTVLAGFPEKIVRLVTKRLEGLGVKVSAGRKITEAKAGEAVLDDGRRVAFDLLIWAGGVRAPGILTKMPFKLEQKGRALVEKEMAVCMQEDPHLHMRSKMYAIGDSVCFYNPTTGKPIPGVARAAISQADIAAHNLIEDIKMQELRIKNKELRASSKTTNYEPKYKEYKPWDYPYIIPVGGKWAVTKIGPFVISGFAGWLLKGLVELNYLASIMPFSRAVKVWLKGLWIFVRNDRLG